MNSSFFLLDIAPEFWTWRLGLIFIGFYLYGSVAFPYLFTRLLRRERLDSVGTGNIGIANAFGAGGLRVGFLSVLGEASKGILPIVVSRTLYEGSVTRQAEVVPAWD
jgi:glycerol-3-phosphate acyltransferase PlsY